jgi:hypothetical protein
MNTPKIIVGITGFLFLLVLGTGIYWEFFYNPVKLTDEEIREEFRCDRTTSELLRTDIYCDDPDLYREHAREGDVVEN